MSNIRFPIPEMPPLPKQMQGRPFGLDEQGKPIKQSRGVVYKGSLNYLYQVIGKHTALKLPAELNSQERAKKIKEAQESAFHEVVKRLNDAIPDPQYHVTAEYLLNEGNSYSREFSTFFFEICRTVCEDPDFHFNKGKFNDDSAVAYMIRPFPLNSVFKTFPRFVAKYSNIDIETIETTATSAVLRMRPDQQLADLPKSLHQHSILATCHSFQGYLVHLPKFHSGLAPAEIKERKCRLQGDEYCEWEFTWETPRPQVGLKVWSGIVISVALLLYTFLRLPAWEWIELVALLPALYTWFAYRIEIGNYERDRQQRILTEQSEKSEQQYDELLKSNSSLQLSNVSLEQKISQLTALYEIGLAVSSVLDLDELLEKSLQAVIKHLNFDRAMIMLVDEKQKVLTDGHIIGGSNELINAVKNLSIPLERKDSLLMQSINSHEPVQVNSIDEIKDEAQRNSLIQFGIKGYVSVPLIVQGKIIGVLLADNSQTNRPIPQDSVNSLVIVGSQIASAVDSARLYQTLEQRVNERTQEAEEARALAENANKAKSAFLATMSHELRTPLNAIIGFTRIVRGKSEGVLPEKQTDNLDKVLSSAEHLLNLINTVLDIAKIEAGRMDVQASNFSINALVDQCFNTVKPLIKPNVKIEKENDITLPLIYSDQNKIKQIILNLLSNAAKFTHDGKIKISVYHENSFFKIDVADTGIGMNEEALSRIFEEFQQADSSTTRQYGGTGLGLSISRNLAHLLGGNLTATSEPNKGSTFTLSLPIHYTDNKSASPSDVQPDSAQQTLTTPEADSSN